MPFRHHNNPFCPRTFAHGLVDCFNAPSAEGRPNLESPTGGASVLGDFVSSFRRVASPGATGPPRCDATCTQPTPLPGAVMPSVPRSLAIALTLVAATAARADDWPQWGGPRRDG